MKVVMVPSADLCKDGEKWKRVERNSRVLYNPAVCHLVVDGGFFPVKRGIIVTCYVIGWSRSLDVHEPKPQNLGSRDTTRSCANPDLSVYTN
jgi:hypothetical protein